MALISMTGYGHGEAFSGSVRVVVELSSLNRKQFDARISVPSVLLALESRIQEAIQRRISRGYVTGTVKVHNAGRGRFRMLVDEERAQAYVRSLRRTARNLRLRDDLSASVLASLPDVVRGDCTVETVDDVWPTLKRALDEAVAELMEMKTKEGRALERDMRCRCRELERRLEKICLRARQMNRRHQKSLKRRLRASVLGEGATIDRGTSARMNEQVVKAAAILTGRSDVTEETARLQSHLRQFGKMMKEGRSEGRALDFMCQEIFREINTVGSKADDTRISNHVVRFKTELERIREQVQNVE